MQKVSPTSYLTMEQRKELLKKNDLRAGLEVLWHWGIITGIFAVVYFFPNVFTVLIALVILGGRQLACSILMHDTAHYALFNNKWLNEWVGQWLGAYPVFQNLKRYRPYHIIHHKVTGLEEDPDILLTRGYPTTRKSMIRKFTRDLTGQTGVKALFGLVLMNLEYLEYNLGGKVVKVDQSQRSWSAFWKLFWNQMGGVILFHVILFLVLYIFASGWLYLLWLGAYFTTFQFCIRVRSMAEHSMVDDPKDPLRNTRTTLANGFEKILFAPYYVNYHAEHHMLMGVPSYNLPRMHKIIKENGFYEKGVLANSYWEVIQMAMRQ